MRGETDISDFCDRKIEFFYFRTKIYLDQYFPGQDHILKYWSRED